jgi:glycosyltransferase involved in cell wall biosynthesis
VRIAIVHDWLTGMRGGEKVLSLLCGLMPNADLFTLFRVPGACDARIERMRIRTSVLNGLPAVRRYYRHLLPLMPLAIEQMDASQHDLVVSCSHCVAKGVIHSTGSAHICYCLTPMRYVWSQNEAYQDGMGLCGKGLRLARGYLRAWDRRTARRVDLFLANSRNVAERIRRCYGRRARVVHSPIDTEFFTPSDAPREDYYLMVTALVPYKRVDQAVAAFARLGRPLRVVGGGPLLRALRRSAPSNVTFTGWQSDRVVRQHYRRCRALIQPGEEDFGLASLEAGACGAPVIAYGAGGALETVIDISEKSRPGPTGLHYAPQTADALAAAVKRFEQAEDRFEPRRLAAWAKRFSPCRFLAEFKQAAGALLREKGLPEPW